MVITLIFYFRVSLSVLIFDNYMFKGGLNQLSSLQTNVFVNIQFTSLHILMQKLLKLMINCVNPRYSHENSYHSTLERYDRPEYNGSYKRKKKIKT